jgi:hypothetical protein
LLSCPLATRADRQGRKGRSSSNRERPESRGERRSRAGRAGRAAGRRPRLARALERIYGRPLFDRPAPPPPCDVPRPARAPAGDCEAASREGGGGPCESPDTGPPSRTSRTEPTGASPRALRPELPRDTPYRRHQRGSADPPAGTERSKRLRE